MKWVTYDPPSVDGAFERLNLSPVIENLLIRRGIEDEETAKKFLYPKLSELKDPDDIKNVSKASLRIKEALDSGQSICILGDYDVDGVTSSALLTKILHEFGNDPVFCVPLRMEEGYGLSREVIDRILSDNSPELFIALDCGTNSAEEIKYLMNSGVDVIVVDHHQSTTSDLPEECILINPHINDNSDEPWFYFCTVGLVFKLVHSLVKLYRSFNDSRAQRIKLKTYLDIVAIGTIADLVPLRGENRLLARYGLRSLKHSNFMGIPALCEVCKLSLDQPIKPSDVSFRLGPRINASGRLADARLPIEMLIGQNYEICLRTAQELDALNNERRQIEEQMVNEAMIDIEKAQQDTGGIVIYREEWHSGVVGIVAGKLSREFGKPCLVLADENGLAKGSVRSAPGVNIINVLEECSEYLTSWGGHPMAAGVALDPDKLEDFSAAFSESITKLTGENVEEPPLEIALWIALDDISDALLEQLELLQPYGQANPEPIFGIRKIRLAQDPHKFGVNHFKFRVTIGGGYSVETIAWGLGDRMPKRGEYIDIAFKAGWNYWNNRRYIQLELVDWRPSDD